MTDDAAPTDAPTDDPVTTPPTAVDPDIAPDTKDWTWVLERRCPACGFVAGEVAPDELPAAVRALTARWQAALARSTAADRPRPDVWSVLEYGAHVRDVHRVFLERFRLVRGDDDPVFDNWDQDATAVSGRYGTLAPSDVADELAQAAEAVAAELATVRPDELARPARRSDGSAFTLRTLEQYYLHDVVHHLHDVGA